MSNPTPPSHREEAETNGAPSYRTTSSDWDIKPFITPKTCVWDVELSKEDIEKLILGFAPVDMDDRWFIFSEENGADAKLSVNFFRSWTGYKSFEVVIKRDVDGGGGRVTELIFETCGQVVAEGITEEDATRMVTGLCGGVLKVNLGGEYDEPVYEPAREDDEDDRFVRD